jgi:hypothetical protein
MGLGGEEKEKEALGDINCKEENMRDSGGSVGISSGFQD